MQIENEGSISSGLTATACDSVSATPQVLSLIWNTVVGACGVPKDELLGFNNGRY